MSAIVTDLYCPDFANWNTMFEVTLETDPMINKLITYI